MKKVAAILLVLITLLIFTNPSEHTFLKQVAIDYGEMHQGSSLTVAELNQMGESDRTSYGVCSTYRYQFGNIVVSYFGVAGATFYIRSFLLPAKPNYPVEKA